MDPSPGDAPGRSLRGPKAGRIVRALCDFPTPLSISDLAAKAGVDVSYASRMVEWLARKVGADASTSWSCSSGPASANDPALG